MTTSSSGWASAGGAASVVAAAAPAAIVQSFIVNFCIAKKPPHGGPSQATLGCRIRNVDDTIKRPEGQQDYWVKTVRSEEHTSELQSLMRISYAVFCLKKKQDRQN